MYTQFKQAVLQLQDEGFEKLALEIFEFQSEKNPIYRAYLSHLKVNPKKVSSVRQIPFLPIQFFKDHKILCEDAHTSHFFESSGTTGVQSARHYMPDLDFYLTNARKLFEAVYGSLSNYVILALLPSYLEKGNSSLVFMVQDFMNYSANGSGFYLNNLHELKEVLDDHYSHGKKVILWGVTYALLDFADYCHQGNYPDLIIMETGGMKGRRKEMIREEIHDQLKRAFGVASVHSEYGMTELTSQFYAPKEGIFLPCPTARIFIREVTDPFSWEERGRSGGLNIIDLANIYSCAFIETKDIGRGLPENKAAILGRFDHADVRGCNLLVQ